MNDCELPPGFLLHSRYTINGNLARGGMSILYIASDSHLPGTWVVKQMTELQGNPEDIECIREQFRKEATILSGLSHPGLPRVIDCFREDGHDYLVEQYIEGKNLDELLEIKRHFSQYEVIEIALQVLDILSYLHERGIIYRDLKPGNVMLDNGGRAYLVDFGIARLFTSGKKTDTVIVGTPGFASPEHYGKGQTDARSDIYSLGATLHNILTGIDPAEAPFSFQPPISIIPGTSRGLSDAIMNALELNPDKRHQTAMWMRDVLKTCIKTPPQKGSFKYGMIVPVRGPVVTGGSWGILMSAVISSLVFSSGDLFILLPGWIAGLGIASLVKGFIYKGVNLEINEEGMIYNKKEQRVKARWEEVNELKVCRTSGIDRTLWGTVTVHPSHIKVTTARGSFSFSPEIREWGELTAWIIYRAGLEPVKSVEEKGADQVYRR